MVANIKQETANKVADIIEQIQRAQIHAGGVYCSQEYFRNMTVAELLYSLVPNDVSFSINYEGAYKRDESQN